MSSNDLPQDLRTLVKDSVSTLGEILRKERGAAFFRKVENTRRTMASLRGKPPEVAARTLSKTLKDLRKLSRNERYDLAHSFTLMLELINACENAYRTRRLREKGIHEPIGKRHTVIYVLTAHPTEARTPENIAVFRKIQEVLTRSVGGDYSRVESELRHLLELAWHLKSARSDKPEVEDEATHLFSILLNPEILESILTRDEELAPTYFRSWVGGDKDGHPGVNAQVMQGCLEVSRRFLLRYAINKVMDAQDAAELIENSKLEAEINKLGGFFHSMMEIRPGDGARITKLRRETARVSALYLERVGALHPSLSRLVKLLRVFPGLVVPLELRESSDQIENPKDSKLAIAGMLKRLAAISSGGDPRWYARGLIISMTRNLKDIQNAATLVHKPFGKLRIPVIPLFEQQNAMEQAPQIITDFIRDKKFEKAARQLWGSRIEIMLGYSDSAKEMGVLASRLLISETVRKLDRVCRKARLQPVFFHGSGGSVDRGGGSLQEQTSWWPESALRFYKATIQGEMVERTFASPEILLSQLEKISWRTMAGDQQRSSSPPIIKAFAERTRQHYSERISSPEFLEVVQKATAYRYLSALRIGSRPTKRSTGKQISSVSALRAIPWVLCWTQTRVLFPTWWGIGSAWKESSASEKKALRDAFKRDELFLTFVKLLSFTLAKVELPMWWIYLEQSKLPRDRIEKIFDEFCQEYQETVRFVRHVTGEKALLWFRPWLGTSIRLRSPMIHPLNLIQVLALENNDTQLIRETVTGISSGMLTTG